NPGSNPGIRDRIRSTITKINSAGAPLPAFDSTDGPLALPPFNNTTGQPGVVVSNITINDPNLVNQVVSSLTLTLNITATNDSDLILTLIAPDGTPIVLAKNEGFGPNQRNFTNTTFDDNGPQSIASFFSRAPYSSPPSYRPEQSLGLLQGK